METLMFLCFCLHGCRCRQIADIHADFSCFSGTNISLGNTICMNNCHLVIQQGSLVN
uniref:Uncharacterized protein n=1 Tax=Arundo donax TaxID=35708 RepID=A0A0A8YI78_ARUDO